MRMIFVVVLEPSGDFAQRGDRIGQRVDANIVAFEGFDEALRDAVRLRALNGGEAGNEIERGCEVTCLLGRVGAAIVCQPFERCRRLEDAEPALDSFQHYVADHAAADARSDNGMPCNDLAVMGIDDEGDPNELSVCRFALKGEMSNSTKSMAMLCH